MSEKPAANLSLSAVPAAFPLARPAGSGFSLLILDRHLVKWGAPTMGTGAVVRYAFVERWVERPGAVNCKTIGPIGEATPGSALGRVAAVAEFRRAMGDWEAAADIRFEPAPDDASADVLIGIQKRPRGIAYADVIPGESRTGGIATIRQAAICFNPELAWETGFDGDARTPDIRYVAGHELGHVLGLDHALGSDKLMDFHYRESFRAPQKADLDGAVYLYGLRQTAPAQVRVNLQKPTDTPPADVHPTP